MKRTTALITSSAIIAAGIAVGGLVANTAEASSPATVTIRYLSDGPCGSVTGTKNAAVMSASTAMSGVRGCVAVFRVVR